MLAGEPGIGKTRLAEELANQATSIGARAIWGRCWESGGAPAFWPWIQVIRGILGRSSTLQSEGAHDVRHLARMLPELGDSLGDFVVLGETSSAEIARPLDDPEAARFRLFDGVTHLLRAAALETPLVLVIDDLHGADADSLLLLKFVARDLHESRILILGTYRDVEAKQSPQHAALLSEIAREGYSIPLRGFSQAEVKEFVELTAERTTDTELVRTLCERTSGNPFFLAEIVRLMEAERTLSQPGAPATLGIPDGVRNVLRRRLAPFSEQGRHALTIAAVIGKEFELTELCRISGLSAEQLADVLGLAETHGLLARVPGEIATYRFNHAITPDVLRGELGTGDLMRLQLKIAEKQEELYGDEPGSHLAELAYRFVEALPIGPAAKAVDYSRRAAERAQSHLAFGEAWRLYVIALRALQISGYPDEVMRCEILLALGEVQKRDGHASEAREVLQQASNLARKLGRSDLLASAALKSSTWSGAFFRIDRKAIALLEEALAVVGEPPSGLRASLMACLAQELALTDRRDYALSLSREAIDVAREVGDIAALIHALWTQYHLYWGPDDIERRIAAANEIVTLAEEASELDWALRVREYRLGTMIELGEFDAADSEIESYLILQEKTGQGFGIVERYRAMRLHLKGDFEQAQRQAQEVLHIAERRQDQPLAMVYRLLTMAILDEQGPIEQNERTVKENLDNFQLAVYRCALAHYYARVRREPEARLEFELLAADDFAGIPRDMNWICSIATLAIVCAYLADGKRGAILYELLRPYAARIVTAGFGDVCYGPVAYYLGLLAATAKRFEQAQAHYEAAIRFGLRMNAKPSLARTQVGYAEMLLQRNQPDDRKRALELLRSASAVSEELGLKPLAAKVREVSSGAPVLTEIVANADLKVQVPSTLPQQAMLRREGDYWTVEHHGRIFRLRHIKGLSYLARLLRDPGVEFHSLDLMVGTDLGETRGTTAAPAVGVEGAGEEQLAEGGLRRGAPEDAGEMLDAEAKAAYRARLNELRALLEDANEVRNLDRADQIEDEIAMLTRELSRAIGLRGRDRRAASDSERARLNVTRAIKSAIDRIVEQDSDLGLYFSRTIRTGTFCSHLPDQQAPISWQF